MPTISDVITTPDGTCRVTLSTPAGDGPWPGVVLYPDAGGPRQTMVDMAERLAGSGYAVLVPDVYYRDGDWAPFDVATVFSDDAERQRLGAMMGAITPDVMARDAVAFFDYLAGRPETTGTSFGTTGYCMGGRMSLVVAGRVPERVAAALSFHGGGLATDATDSPHLLADAITATVYVGAAENDRSFTAEQSDLLDDALTTAGVDHVIDFYSAGHGFAVPDMATFDEAAARRHWEATTRVFGAALT